MYVCVFRPALILCWAWSMSIVQAWVEEIEQVISSQASFDTFQPAQVGEIASRWPRW